MFGTVGLSGYSLGFPIRYVFAKDDDLPAGEVVTADMQLGDVLLLGNLVPHCKCLCSILC